MTLTIPHKFADISVSTKQNGDMSIEFPMAKHELIDSVLADILYLAKTEHIIANLTPTQLAEIKAYEEE